MSCPETKLMKPEIKYYDSYERFGMSGPWYGKLIVNNKELRYDFFEENDISNESNLIAFNRFEGKWIFKILILNIESNKWYISNKSFNALLLLKFLNQKIYFKETFFDLPRFEIIELEFNESNFTEIENGKV